MDGFSSMNHGPLAKFTKLSRYTVCYFGGLGKLTENTVNLEIFVYENIHVLNIRVNKFSRVPHENILT